MIFPPRGTSCPVISTNWNHLQETSLVGYENPTTLISLASITRVNLLTCKAFNKLSLLATKVHFHAFAFFIPSTSPLHTSHMHVIYPLSHISSLSSHIFIYHLRGARCLKYGSRAQANAFLTTNTAIMARLSTVNNPAPDPTAINLTRMIARLQKILISPDQDTESKLRSSSLERERVATVSQVVLHKHIYLIKLL